ncbi:STAS/SEC14 domain-containing protein [Pyxidicoccus parkwayensis]|uniref:STAS/SEC14 domain-containing protein n=1 Tax=Pyxidicoccus parkwayensis TaxID=2813578 RepID=A0ABX7NNR0_9BACT|nr:STAS/SEC14 domain-containing protein [Pyxidicoccus parkwaysis]QSQ19036.1 STAS/SEC14 domain-containing protein [Pyxidicoccus parkwaysis]
MHQEEVRFGTHHAHFEPPDTLVATFNGPISMDEVKLAVQVYRENYERRGQYFCIVDVGRSELDTAGRRYLSEHGRSEWFHAAIYVGANLMQRTIGKAIALALLFTGKTMFDTVFLPTVEEARVWVAQHRHSYRQRKAS